MFVLRCGKRAYEGFLDKLETLRLERFKNEIKAILKDQWNALNKNASIEKAYRGNLVPKQIRATNKKTGKVYITTVYVNPNTQNGLKKYKEQNSIGAKLAIAKLYKTVENCKTSQELLDIVLRNKGRFQNEKGEPLPIVERLRKFAELRNETLERRFNPLNSGYVSQLRKELKKNLRSSLGLHTNKKTGIKANLPMGSIDKMGSEKAVEKSKANGFTIKEHFEVANRIVELYENADLIKVSKDKNESKDLISVKRFSCNTTLEENKKVCAYITVKESITNGHRIYSVEVMNLKKCPL